MQIPLKEIDLTLARAISKCQAQEAAKKQSAGLHNYSTESVVAIHKLQDWKCCPTTSTCPGCSVPLAEPNAPHLL